MIIALLGYMGAGKSSIGKRLSAALGYEYIDLDAYIEKVEKEKISTLFKTKGEIYFRKIESDYLSKLIQKDTNTVIALGGGTPCYGTVMQDLLGIPWVKTLYLNCSVETLTERLWQQKDHRPLIAHIASKEELNEYIRKHLFERGFFYNQAEMKVIAGDQSEKQIVEKILLELF